MDRETATSLIVVKKRRMCEGCGHRHREGIYCHVYNEAPEDSDEEDDDIEDRSDGSDNNSLGLEVTAMFKPKETDTPKELETPAYVSAINYTRCNCNLGIPQGTRAFEAIPAKHIVGEIHVQMWEDIMEASMKKAPRKLLSADAEAIRRAQIESKRQAEVAAVFPFILEFLPLGQCCHPAVTCKYWNQGATNYQKYVDMRNCIPWQV